MRIFVLSSFVLLLTTVFLTACNKSAPKDVAKEWLTDFYHQDYDAAKKLSTEEAKIMINTIQGFTNSFPDSIKQKAKNVTIMVKTVKEEGNTATVTFVASDDTKEQPPLKLVKQNDRWLVQFSKGDFTGGDSKDNNTGGATLSPDNGPAPAAEPASSAVPADTAHH